MNETLKRVLIALIAIPIVLWAMFYNKHVFSVIVLITSVLISMEVLAIAELKSIRVYRSLTLPIGILLIVMQYLSVEKPQTFTNANQILLAIIFISSFLLFAIETFQNDFSKTLELVAIHVFVLIYCNLSTSYIIRLLDTNPYYFLFILVVTWMSDTGAYFTGKTLGRHKLNLKASPNKTAEGFIGGIIFPMLSAVVLKLIFPTVFYDSHILFSYVAILLMSFGFAVTAIFGDLAGSVIKRSAGVKDSMNYIPGHGGALDVMDSLIYNAPLFYFIVTLV